MIHRSQGDTETNVVASFRARQAIPNILYVSLSRVTTIEGLYITKLCEDKISVSTDVKNEMERLRTKGSLQLTTSLMTTSDNAINVCFLDARSLHKHIDDIRNDLYYKNSDVCMFVETRFHHRDTVCILLMAITCIGMMATHLTPRDLMVGQQCIAELSSCLDILLLKYQWHKSN